MDKIRYKLIIEKTLFFTKQYKINFLLYFFNLFIKTGQQVND